MNKTIRFRARGTQRASTSKGNQKPRANRRQKTLSSLPRGFLSPVAPLKVASQRSTHVWKYNHSLASKYIRIGWLVATGIVVVAIGIATYVGLGQTAPKISAVATPVMGTAFVFGGVPVSSQVLLQAEQRGAQLMYQHHRFQNTPAQQRILADYAVYTQLDDIETPRQLALAHITSVSALITAVAPLQAVSAEDAQVFYVTHQNIFSRGDPQVHVREIIVTDKHQADSIHDQLQHGASFAALASQYSTDPATYKQAGGDMGWITTGLQMPTEWDEVALSLSEGQISDVFSLPNTSFYCVVQAIEAPKYVIIPFDQVHPSVATVAAQYNQQQRYVTWLSQQILKEPLTSISAEFAGEVTTAMADLRIQPDQHFDSL